MLAGLGTEELRWCAVVLIFASGVETGVGAWCALRIAALGYQTIGAIAGVVELLGFGVWAFTVEKLGVLGIASARLFAVAAAGASAVGLLAYMSISGRSTRKNLKREAAEDS